MAMSEMDLLLRTIPGASQWISCAPLLLGWSQDRKYRVTDADGRHLLLRVANDDQYEKKLAEWNYLNQVATLHLTASYPLEFGRFEGGVYMLLTWLEGEPMEQALSSLPPARQYLLGLEAGRALARLHTLPAPSDTPDWYQRMNRKFDRKIRNALDCPLEIPGAAQMIDFINDHRALLKNRPQSMHHGDYHCGNMVLTLEGQVGIIDFNRFDAGDPWEEFNRIVWCAQVSPAFASGRINGYFNALPPEDFFTLTAAYIFSNQLSSLPWAIPFGEGEIQVMLRQAREVLSWYQNGTVSVPSWYLTPEQASLL